MIARGVVWHVVLVFVAYASSTAMAAAIVTEDTHALFESWAAAHGRKYGSADEHHHRRQIFADNVHAINLHNLDPNKTFVKAVNHFADLTLDEFRAKYTGLREPIRLRAAAASTCPCPSPSTSPSVSLSHSHSPIPTLTPSPTPVSKDWSSTLPPVKDQGQCGSCWAFATTAAVEHLIAVKNGTRVTLSEQQLVDCSSENYGCDGGLPDAAIDFVVMGGQCPAAAYPYRSGASAVAGRCAGCAPVPATTIHIKHHQDVHANSASALLAAVNQQVVIIGLAAGNDDFQFYSSGVLTSGCHGDVDHAVALVGYGVTANNVAYWRIRNSWGPTWGDHGYINLGRTPDGTPGICSMYDSPSYPVWL